MSRKTTAPILGAIKIAGLYLLIGFLWILFSDQLVDLLVSDQDLYHQISVYKGWGYVLVTGILLYFLIKNHTDRLSIGEAWLRMAYDAAKMGTWRHDISKGVVYFDDRARIHYGFDSLEASLEDVISHVHPDDISRLEKEIAGTIDPASGGRYTTEYRVIHTNGSVHWLEVDAYVSFVGDMEKRRPVLGVGTSRDITESKQANLQIHYFSRLYATLSQVNQAIVRSKDQRELFENICKVSVDFGEFRLAWIGLLDDELGLLTPVAEYGFQGNKLPFHNINFREMPYKEGLIGLALRSGQVEFSNDIQVDPRMEHWQETAIRDNYHSAAAVPIRKNEQIIGLLNLYAADVDFFMVEEERRLLEEMGLDISFALDTMQLEMENKQAERLLVESEEKYRMLLNSTVDGVFVAQDEKFVFANPAFPSMLGYSSLEFENKLFSDVVVPEYLDLWMVRYTQRVTGGNPPSTYHVKFMRKDGMGDIWVELHANKIMYREKPAVLGIVRDISERKQAEKQLLESEERFQKAFRSGPVGLAITRALDGVYIEANTAFSEIVGFSHKELIGETSLKLNITTPEQRNEYTHVMASQGFIRDQEMSLRHRSGELRTVLGSMEIIELNNETCVLSTAIDITERKKTEESLRKSDERWEMLVKTIPDFIALFDKDGRYLFLNHYLEGYTEKDVIGRANSDFILDESKATYLAAFEKAKQTGQVQFVEYKAYGAAGLVRLYDNYFTPIFENGDFVSMLALARDITERKNSEDKLLESEERFRQLADNIEETFWIFDPLERKDVYISPAFEKIWMRSAQDFFEDPEQFFESIIPEDRPHAREVTSRQAQGEKTEMQYRITRPDGSVRWIWDRSFPVFDEEGKLIRVAGILADITENKKAEMQLLELNQTLEQRVKERTAEVQDLYENAPAGYHSLDVNGLIVRINQTELNWLGYSREELVGVKAFAEIITLESQRVFFENFPRFKAQGWIKDLEFELIRKDGSILPILLNATAVYDEHGNFIRSRSTMVDITERKQAELQLQAANETLERASRLKDEFLANMSHELRTPLNAVIGLSESLQVNTYGELNPRQLKTVDVIRQSGRHLLELINDILDLSKIGAGMVELQYETINLKKICEASLLMVAEAALKKEIQITMFITEEVQTINADHRRLKQMIVNLLSNAVKFTSQNGQIKLEVLPENDYAVRFTVWDNGIGISADQLGNLFKPFVQVDSSLTRRYEGTGLGLALVRQLAEMHNGSIGVESELGKGSSFYFIIPKLAMQNYAREETMPDEISIEENTISPSSTTILLVEDNPTNMMFTSDYLTMKGYNLVTAENGLMAIEKAYIHYPNLILMDIQMPELDGIETIKRLRSSPEFATVPIIALTALAMPGDRERCLAAGANEYLAKPVSLKKLLDRIIYFLT